jgi:hypothetical protein
MRYRIMCPTMDTARMALSGYVRDYPAGHAAGGPRRLGDSFGRCVAAPAALLGPRARLETLSERTTMFYLCGRSLSLEDFGK